MADEWTVRRILDWCGEYLQKHGDENPRLSAEWLVGYATGLSRIELYMNFDRPLSMAERDALRPALKRRGAGEPLQYISGEAAFRHIVVKTARGVLIPRPETEVLVSVVLDYLSERGLVVRHPAQITVPEGIDDDDAADDESDALAETPAPQAAHVLEVGTGTGCIALSLAREAGAHVVATDISPAALACSRANAAELDERGLVEVVEADCVGGIARGEGFDVLVSNPPYIPTSVLAELPHEVSGFEPELALDGGADGLEFFDRLLDEALPLVKSGGLLACELHETCCEDAAARMRDAGFADVAVTRDLADRPRIVSGIVA